jgi:integrase
LAKKKPKYEVLTWFESRKVWKKKYKGKVHYLGPYGVKRTRETHDAAFKEWLELKTQIDAEAKASEHTEPAAVQVPLPSYEPERNVDLDSLKTVKVQDSAIISYGKPVKVLYPVDARYVNPDGSLKSEPQVSRDLKLSTSISGFLARKQAQAQAGERSTDRVDALRVHLEHFQNWFDAKKSIKKLSPQVLEEYHTHLIRGKGSAYTKRDRFAALKQFVRWLAEQGRIPLPANIDSKDFTFRIEAKTIKTMPVEELQALLEASSDRVRLYLLLMANAGMQQTDIAELRAKDVDLKKGTITRVRSKTAHHASAPTITYKLWPETLKLLKKEKVKRATGDARILVNENGLSLVRRVIKEDGKLKRLDNIKSAIDRVYRTMKAEKGGKAPSLPPKHIRKTCATLLAGEYDISIATDYLADVPSGVMARHYVKPDQAKFDKAIMWLGKKVLGGK